MVESASAPRDRRRIAVVGPCGSGKSVLVLHLRALGYDVREPAQEHSAVPDMWQRIAKPDVLIYLDAGLSTIARRRRIDWGQEYLSQLHRRLAHARRHADLYLPTDGLTAEQVFQRVRAFLEGSSCHGG